MAYSKEMKRINLALSPEDQIKFLGIKSFLKLDKDADVVRECITETFMNLCFDCSKLESINRFLEDIDNLKHDLNKILIIERKEL